MICDSYILLLILLPNMHDRVLSRLGPQPLGVSDRQKPTPGPSLVIQQRYPNPLLHSSIFKTKELHAGRDVETPDDEKPSGAKQPPQRLENTAWRQTSSPSPPHPKLPGRGIQIPERLMSSMAMTRLRPKQGSIGGSTKHQKHLYGTATPNNRTVSTHVFNVSADP